MIETSQDDSRRKQSNQGRDEKRKEGKMRAVAGKLNKMTQQEDQKRRAQGCNYKKVPNDQVQVMKSPI